jgi:hypothetical protein
MFLVVAAATLFQLSALAATGQDATVFAGRIEQRFPLMAKLLREMNATALPPTSDAIVIRDFVSGDFTRPYAIQSGSSSVLGSPVAAGFRSLDTHEANAAACAQLFAGVNAYRWSGASASNELLIIRNREAVRSIVYRLSDATDIALVMPWARGVRLIPTSPGIGRTMAYSAPLAVDASGRLSTGVRWQVNREGETFTLSLKLDDRRLRFPIALSYAVGDAEATDRITHESLTRASAPLKPIVNGTGVITGQVTAADTGLPISGEIVEIYSSTADYVTFGATDATGHYTSTDGLNTGSYFVTSWAYGYNREVYNNIQCPFECDVTIGTPVSVTSGATTSNINFALDPIVARITGTVTNASNGSPLEHVGVLAYDSVGTVVGYSETNASGKYEFVFEQSGTHYVRTANNVFAGLVDQVYSGTPCVGCDPTAGTAITANVGSTVGNINFSLNPNGGRIAGRLTESATSAAIQFGSVVIYNAAGQAVTYAESDATGNYVSFHGLTTGSYYVLAKTPNYRAELYDNIPCGSGCTVTTGAPVGVVLGQRTSNIDFALNSNIATVSGKVTDRATGAPLGNVGIIFYDGFGSAVKRVISDGSDGTYQVTLPGGGTYFARTKNQTQPGYVDQLYSGKDCTRCVVKDGTPIVVESGTPVTNVSFQLTHDGGTIRGRVTDSVTGRGVSFATVQIVADNGEVVSFAFSDGNGDYLPFHGLATGMYYAIVYASGFGSQIYRNLSCSETCDPLQGTPIAVTQGQATTGIDFPLSSTQPRMTGRVTAAQDGSGLSGISVLFFDATGDVAASTYTGTSGDYEVFVSTPGTYYARTAVGGIAAYSDQLYKNLPCDSSCDPLTGTAITATAGQVTTGVDFQLATSGCPLIDVQPNVLSGGQVGDEYSADVAASNGTAPFAYQVVRGSLPSGLTLNSSTGTISGTLTAAGTYTFTIRATDAHGCSGEQTYTVQVIRVATSTSLVVSTTSATYGTALTLTATVTTTLDPPPAVTGTVSFLDGSTVVGTVPLNGSSASLTITPNAGAHSYSAHYDGTTRFAPSDSPSTAVSIAKATPSITWPAPAPITYGVPLSSTQLNATASTTGTFLYSPPAGTILDAGTYTLNVTFTPSDVNNYNSASASVSLLVHKADQQIVWPTPADIVYGTPLSPSQLNATVVVPGLSPPGALTYSPAAGTILAAGTHTLSVTVAATSNYNEATANVTILVKRAAPVFSELSAPVVVIGTPSVTISGKISAGSLIPPGNVTITLNSTSVTAPIGADRSFSAAFDVATLLPVTAGYPITFTYSGDSNFEAAAATSTLTVTYATSGGPVRDPSAPGSNIPFRVQLLSASGTNLSSDAISVRAYGVRNVNEVAWQPAEPSGDGGSLFLFQNANGGTYSFNLKTTGLPPGDYVLGFTADNDPVIHTVAFSLK